MQSQTLVVIGNPMRCGQIGCAEPATVLLRQFGADHEGSEILYCDTCWIATRRSYSPLVEQDRAAAVREVMATLRYKDDGPDATKQEA